MADADDAVVERLDRLERQMEELQELRRELVSLRALAVHPPADAVEVTEPVITSVEPATPPPVPETPSAPPLTRAWRSLERGDATQALTTAFEALRLAREAGDTDALAELAAFAVAASELADESQGRRVARLRQELDEAQGTTAADEAASAAAEAPPAPVEAVVRTLPPRHSPPVPTPAPAAAAAREPSFADRAVVWLRAELTGPRAFALVGGTVTLLGVIFLFVLAANRGWVGPGARVALGAAVSLALLGAGFVLRTRYGQLQASLAAVGVGIASAYTTLAAATMLYSYIPPWGALLVAAGIAAAGGWIAVAWSSQIVAGLALVGAAAAPGLASIDEGITWQGAAFALVVLAATIAVASPLRWLWLLGSAGAVVVGQLVWLIAAAPIDDAGAVAVTGSASLVLLGAAIVWQAYGRPGLDGPAATFALVAAAIALWSPLELLSERRDAGLVLLALALVFAVVAVAGGRYWPDLAWTIGAGALLLGGVAAASLVSGRSLTTVWAIEATTLAALAWKLKEPRFQASALVYLTAAAVHALAVEIVPDWPDDAFDIPGSAAPGLFVLAAASLTTGLLSLPARTDKRAAGIAARLEPTWDALVRARIEVRALLAIAAASILAAATAAVLSGRWLTITWALLATLLGAAAFALGERRLQPFALGYLTATLVHVLVVDAPPDTFVLDRLSDPLVPVASIGALAGAAAVLAVLARFENRGIAWLGPLAGPERSLDALRREEDDIRATLALVAAIATIWICGLVAIEISYEPGQVVATALWGMLGTVVVTLAARARALDWQVAGGTIVILALLKSAAFDWYELGDDSATASLLIAASALLLAGFLCRWENPAGTEPVEIASLSAGAVATVAAIVALERVLDIDSRGLGVATLAVVAATVAAGVPPYLGRRRGRKEPWLRTLANGYWALALAALLFAESIIVLQGATGTIALWAATAAVLALVWKPLAEDRVWLAAAGLAGVAGLGALALLTVPSKLVEATAHPGSGLWAFALVVIAAWAAALTVPRDFEESTHLTPWVLGTASALTLYGVSLGVLELAERVSGASVETDFQRGHTALSALWGVGALAVYVLGLARDRRDLRIVGLTLFGLALAKLLLYDLSTLSSITRALSFLAVGAILMVAGFFSERIVRPGADGPTPDAPGSPPT